MFRFNQGIPNLVTLYGVPTRGESLVKGEIGVFAQDRWTIQRWTFNGGVRYDGFIGGYPDQSRGPAPLQPTRNFTFPAVTTMSLHDVTPRLGASYDLFGNGKTALKASLGKYMLTLFTIGNPAGLSLALNGRPLTLPGRTGVPLQRLAIRASGIVPSDSLRR